MRLDQKAALMSALPLFQTLEPQALHVLAFSAQLRTLAPGDRLFGKGDGSDGGFIVVSGRIALNPDGVTAIGAEQAGAGTLIGEAALVSETARPATAIALEPTVVLQVRRDLIRQVLESHPDSAVKLHAHIAARLAEMQARLSLVV